MSDYRRLISYIYAYDKDVKGHSVGFAKLESRNGQCKISISVKKLYMGNAEWNVFLLTGEQEIPIGRFYIRGQGGEFRTVVQSENVERSGYPLSAMHGLSIHGDNAESRYYMTIWEEPNVHAAELEVEGELQAAEEAKEAKEAVQPVLTAYVPDAFQMESQAEEALQQADSAYASAPGMHVIEASLETEQQVQDMEDLLDRVDYLETEKPKEMETAADPQAPVDSELIPKAEALGDSGALPEAEELSDGDGLEEAEVQNVPYMPEMDGITEEPEDAEPELVPGIEDIQSPEPIVMGERRPEESNWQIYAQTASRGQLPLWEKLRKRYAKIQAFDYAGGCEILTIKPQDIGLLPRENWVYGNNSFLLHAYYNYRYLILVKLDEPDGTSRYLLGVPGMYYTNEKYMASMFGFPEFILAKKQPHKDGRFGYWYAEVKI